MAAIGGKGEIPTTWRSLFVILLLPPLSLRFNFRENLAASSLPRSSRGLCGMIEGQVGHGPATATSPDRRLALFIFTSNPMGLFAVLNPPTANPNVTFGPPISFACHTT